MEVISRKYAQQHGLKRYFTGKPCSKGHVSERTVDNCICVECQLSTTREWIKQKRLDNPEECNAKSRAQARRLRINNPVSLLLTAARRRAKQKGIEFNLSPEDIHIPIVCPVSGIVLGVADGRQSDASPSLDRIDNSKGYVRGNVRVISWRVNRRKSDLSTAEIIALAEYVRGER